MLDFINDRLTNEVVKSVYPYNELSIQELLNKFYSEIKNTTEISNRALHFLEWLVENGVNDETRAELQRMYDDGRLERLVNINKYNELDDKFTNELNTVNSEINQISYNVKSFGAKGDGVTNDDIPINEADSKGGILLFPPGRYILSSPPNSKSYGIGAVLVVEGGYEMALDGKPLEVNSMWQSYTRLNNTDLGINAGKKLTPSNYGNVSIGNNAMKSAEDGVIKNIAIGHNALADGTWLYQNTVMGTDACAYTNFAERNTIVGSNAGLGIGDSVVVGKNHMFRDDVDTSYLDVNWAGWREYAGTVNNPNFKATDREQTKGNTAIGRNSLGWAITPQFCTALGYNALEKALNGQGSTAIGVNSAYNTIKSANDVIVGYNSGLNLSDSEGNVTLGVGAIQKLPHGKWNVAIGYQSMNGVNNTTDETMTDNIAIGRFSLSNTQGNLSSNVAIGPSAQRYATGSSNVSVGQLALRDIQGENNTAIGTNAGTRLINCRTVTALGYNALNATTYDGYENITGVGNNSTVTGSNQVQLGNADASVYAFSAVQIRSDKRDKLDIEDSELGLDFIKKLRPVKYRQNFRESYIDYDVDGNPIKVENDGSRAGKRKHYGFIAQEVGDILTKEGIDFAGYQDHSINGGQDVKSLSYEEFIAPMVKAIQELSERVEYLEKQLKK